MANSGIRTPLFARHQPGGLFSVVDETMHARELWFVDSTKTATGGDTVGHGRGPDSPFLTLDYAFSSGEMAPGDEVFLGAGHVEDGDAVLFDMDVAGIRVVGLGRYGTDEMARFDFNNAASTVEIGANGCTLENIKFRPSAASVLIGVNIETGIFGTTIKGCKFSEAETAGDEFVVGIQLTSGNSGTRILGNDMRTEPAAGAATHAVNIVVDSHNVTINDNVMLGNWSTAAIGEDADTGSENIMISGNSIKVADGAPGITLDNNTFGTVSQNEIVSTGTAIDAMIVAVLCARVENYGVTADNTTAQLIGPQLDGSWIAAELGLAVVRGASTIAQTGILPKFTIAGGRVLVTAVIGRVTVNIQNQANATSLEYTPTAGTMQVMCATLDIDNDPIGTIYGLTGAPTDTMKQVGHVMQCPMIMEAGTIEERCAASNTGEIQWTCYYKPLVAGATVVAA